MSQIFANRLTKLYPLAVLSAILLIALILILPLPESWKAALIDNHPDRFPWFSIQVYMWFAFCIGMAELGRRYFFMLETRQDLLEAENGISSHSDPDMSCPIYELFFNPEHLVTLSSLKAMRSYERVKRRAYIRTDGIGRILMELIGVFLTTRSAGQTHSILNSTINSKETSLDTEYSLPRFYIWLVPTLGFLGTVWGIILALNTAALNTGNPELLKLVTADLGVAFTTTALGLVQSAIMVFVMHIVQADEERLLAKTAKTCLDIFVARILEEQ